MDQNIRKDLNIIAVPLIIQSIMSMVIAITDQAMVSRISVSAFGAVGSIFQLLYTVIGILGCNVIIFNIHGSRAKGKNNKHELSDEFSSSILINILIGLTLIGFLTIFQKPLITLIFGFEGSILTDSLDYLSIVKWWIVLQLVIFSTNTYLKIIKRTTVILFTSVAGSLLNLCLNYILIFGKFGIKAMGIRGAGTATVLSISITLIVYLFILRNEIKIDLSKTRQYLLNGKNQFLKSFPIMGQDILENNVFLILIVAIVARQGEIILASYLLMFQLLNILQMPAYMYAQATLTLYSEESERNKRQALKIPPIAIRNAIGIYLVISLVFVLFDTQIVSLINPNSEVVTLITAIMFFYLISGLVRVGGIIFTDALQAQGKSKFILKRSAIVNFISIICLVISNYILSGKEFLISCAIILLLNYGMTYFTYKREFLVRENDIERVFEKAN